MPDNGLPDDWRVCSAGHLFEVLDSRRVPLSQSERATMRGPIPYYGANGVVDYIDKWIFDEDLILLAEDGGNFEEFRSRQVAYRVRGKSWVNNHAHVLRPKDRSLGAYLFFQLEHRDLTPFINGTTRSKLTQRDLLKVCLPVAPPAEAVRIAEVLDSIDAAIEKTEAVIAATERLRSALLGELLTRGVPGWHTEWTVFPRIGRMPTCWELVRLGDCGKWLSGGTPSKSRPDFWTGPVPWVSPKDMKVRIISDTEDHISQEAAAELRCVGPGAILVVVRGMILAHSFPVAMTSREVAFNQDIRALVSRTGIMPGYLLAFLESRRDSLVRLATPSTHGTMRIVSEELFDVQVPKPDEREQGRICESIGALDERIDVERDSLLELTTLKPAVAGVLLSGRLRVGELRG